MPEIIGDLVVPGELRPAVRYQSAQRKDLQERAAGEQNDEQNGEQESGNGIADDDDAGGPDVERRAVPHRLADAERNRDQIAQQRHPDAERDRDWEFLLDQLDDADVAEIALAEIEARIVPQHQEKALIGRLVEAELLFQALDEGGIEPLRAAIFGVDLHLRGAAGALGAEITTGTGDARGCAGVAAGELRDDALHRAAGRELYHREGHQHDPEDGGDHEQQAADDVGGHSRNSARCCQLLSGGGDAPTQFNILSDAFASFLRAHSSPLPAAHWHRSMGRGQWLRIQVWFQPGRPLLAGLCGSDHQVSGMPRA